MIALCIVLYLVGVIASYLLRREYVKKDFDDWTVGERTFTIITSVLFSWVGALSTLIMRALDHTNDKPAKW